ncbi:NIPSNAP family protein [Mucilaginibacter ginsenosidivorans]|uniref:NIPSNAP family containing protein n=1 Tax=Mucilaginibacter ginsenosidivorans TaxID=398053 RepID=A0A5B8V155_9SPHI|nr:NIPSNAP family protein [Mucilaginibacter ginsenosidivorans]QEC64755.1 NIPSNAP family containing protein [Mucilaginibacter ginsenosidivorans]
MKTRYIKLLSISWLVVLGLAFTVNAQTPRYYYQIKVYHLKTQAQEDRLDNYFKNAYLPALHRAHITNVGVFKPVEQDTAEKKIYILIPYSTMTALENTDNNLLKDKKYLADGKDYIDVPFNDAPYNRIETIVLKAFPKAPVPEKPVLKAAKADRVYELRSYESPTEKYHINKVKMFNDGGETVLFKRLNFNAVFYADVISGSHMPNLMYMTTFESKADRDEHWQKFSNDEVWKKLSAAPEYQHNVSKADIIFLHPTEYSDF